MRIESRIDLSLNVFCVMVDDGSLARPYYFNVPTQPEGRGAQLFECCVAEALCRHEAWVSGNYQPEGQSPSLVASTPTTAAPVTEVAVSPAATRKPVVAAEPEAPAVTPQSSGTVKKKKAPAASAPVVEAPKPVEVRFEKNAFCKKAFADCMTAKLGADWSKDPDYAAEGKAIAKALEAEGIIVAIDGEIAESFKVRIVEELEARYEFE